MKNLCIIGMLSLFALNVFASPEITTKCTLKEKVSGKTSKTDILDITTISPEMNQAIAMKPKMAIDSDALYILTLAKGEEHTDATGDVSGANYYLSLIRQQDETRNSKFKHFKGHTSDMAFFQVKYDLFYKVSHANRRGKHILGAPKSLKLDYKLSRGKRVKLECEIISIR